ncbi:MAG TPA: DNA-processing protein DprA, partial [Pseudomonadales bacterium]|nr:DNA-processing protein DprA [Pseudomonadales bacterium]
GGLAQLYPKQHISLAKSICEQGAIISEMPVDLAATPPLFPRRNRIISGLSIATVVIEAALRSGSLITARYAMDQGRDVFAMPGSVLNPLAAGCHNLIRQGAGLVENGEQVLEAIGCWSPLLNTVSPIEPGETMDAALRALLDKMGFDPVPVDTLASRTGLSIPTLTQQLLELELEGQVQSCAGGFVRVA